jgi:hypothetical protein
MFVRKMMLSTGEDKPNLKTLALKRFSEKLHKFDDYFAHDFFVNFLKREISVFLLFVVERNEVEFDVVTYFNKRRKMQILASLSNGNRN